MNPNLVLVDTSAWLLVLGRKINVPEAKERVEKLLAENRVAVTPIVSLELLGGTRSRDEFGNLKNRLEALHQLPIGKKEWERAANLAFELRGIGISVPYTDILIASAALQSSATLLHADRHFDVIAESTGLVADSLVSLVRKTL